MARYLAAVLTLSLFLLTTPAAADEFTCGTAAPPDTTGGGQQTPPAPSDYDDLGLIFHRYTPTSGNGALDLEFTYSEAIRDNFSTGTLVERTAALHAALDALAAKLCDEVDNTIGSSWTDFEFLHNWYGGDDAVAYPYGDPYYALPANGGRNMFVDHRDPPVPPDPSNVNHVDIVFRTKAESAIIATHDILTVEAAGQFPEPQISGFPSDEGETFGANSYGDSYYHNGVQVSVVPKAPEWDGYYELIHELGHLFDLNTGFYPGAPWNHECIPQIGCGFAGTYPDDLDLESGYSHPFMFSGMQPSGYESRYQHGAIWGSYFFPQFEQLSSGHLDDGLLWRLRDLGLQQSSALDYYWGRYPALLGHSTLDDATRFPYLQDGSSPLTGEERLHRIFTNFVTALAVNAPHIGVGEYSFPGGFSPYDGWSFFRDNGITDLSNEDRAPNALTVPPVFDVSIADTLAATITSPIVYDDLPLNLELKLYPWSVDLFEIKLADDIDGLGAGTYVKFDLVGLESLRTDAATGYEHVLGARLALYPDIGDSSIIWRKGEAVISIVEPDIIENNGLVTVSCRIPADGSIRNAVLAVTLMESGMPEAWLDNDYIRSGPVATAPRWAYQIEYEVRSLAEDAVPPSVALLDASTATGLDFAGQPYASVAFDYDEDEDEDLFVASSTGVGSLHEFDQLLLSGVPQFLKVAAFNFGLVPDRPQVDLKGLSFADYDNDGDFDLMAGHNVTPRLYRNNDDGTFTDVAGALGVRPPNEVWVQCGTWADYDGDGWVDLFVGRGSATMGVGGWVLGEWPDRLLRNDLAGSGSFIDVSASAGIDQNPLQYDCTLTGAWGDYDLDGDLDLFTPRVLNPVPVGPGGPNSGSHLYVNQGNGTFVENSDTVFPENIIWVNGASWVDIDSDADLDLVCSSGVGAMVSTRVYRNDEGMFTYVSHDIGLAALGETVGATPVDIDLDGMMDLLTIPLDDTLTPRLHTNVGAGGSAYFVDFASTLGLEAGSTSGQVVNDFNDDGDLDLFLGRPVADGKFFYKNAQDATTDAPANHWAAVEFASDISCLDNRASIGATVTIKLDGIPRQVQVVDGGSSRGGQQPLRLTFGLGQDTTSNVQFAVTWPSGVSTTVNGTRDGVTLIGAAARGESVPVPIVGTTTAYYSPGPGGTADWTFQWVTSTYYACGLDRVEVSSPSGTPAQCWIATQTWSSNSGGLQSTVVQQTDGSYLHTLVVEDQDCTGKCSYLYKVSSALNATTYGESNLRTLSTPYCVQ